MAILIFMQGSRGNALVAKGKAVDLEKQLEEIAPHKIGDLEQDNFITLEGFLGGKIIIMNPFVNVTYFMEQSDKEVRENQLKAKERQKAVEREMKGGSPLIDPIRFPPGGKGN